ncbi:Ctf8p and Ctf18p associating protein [Coemansia sp. RSA 2618]|nr:Ctf8p and Ctf18p associating protein [Coemansia sp. RSA 2618]
MTDGAAANTVLELSASDGYPEEFRLLELTPEMAAQLESADATLVVRGRDSDTAVLIDTAEQAYQMHTAHTSNSLYLFTQHGTQLTLRTKLHQVFDLQRTSPQIHARVTEVLGWDTRGPFRGAEFERDSTADSCVTDEVLERHVQAGSRQLRRVLADIPAFRHRGSGHWRVLDASYCMELLRVVLATQVERDWSLDALNAADVFAALRAESPDVLPEVVEAVLGRFGSESLGTFAVDIARVSRYLAEQIFASEGTRAWPVPEFLRALQATMPPQLPLNIDMDAWGSRGISSSVVRGLAVATAAPADEHMLHSEVGVPAALTLLQPLDKSALAQDVRARMRGLFAVKSKWTAAEMRPFLEDFVDSDEEAAVKKAVDSWLLKFGRGVRGPGGESIYTSRIN